MERGLDRRGLWPGGRGEQGMVPGGGALSEEGGCISIRPHWGNGEKTGNPNLLWSCQLTVGREEGLCVLGCSSHGLTRRLARVGSLLEFGGRAKVTLK